MRVPGKFVEYVVMVLASAFAAFSMAMLPAFAEPSFSCATVLAPDEEAICRNPQLSELDRTVSLANKVYRKLAGKVAATKLARATLQNRASCGSDGDCIRRAQLFALHTYAENGVPRTWDQQDDVQIIPGRCHMDACVWYRLIGRDFLFSNKDGYLLQVEPNYGEAVYKSGEDYNQRRKIAWSPTGPLSSIGVFCSKVHPAILWPAEDGGFDIDYFDFKTIYGYQESSASLYFAVCHGLNSGNLPDDNWLTEHGYGNVALDENAPTKVGSLKSFETVDLAKSLTQQAQ